MDTRAREREREGDGAGVLADQLRRGELDRRAVEFAARLGHVEARIALGGIWEAFALDSSVGVLERMGIFEGTPGRALVSLLADLAARARAAAKRA